MSDREKSALDEWLKRKKKTASKKGIGVIPENKPALLSYGQERLWLLDQLYPGQALYNYAHQYNISGSLDLSAFSEAFQNLAQRHQILLSNYLQEDGHLVQKVKHEAIPIEHVDLSLKTAEIQLNESAMLRARHINQHFDLENDPLFKLYTYRLSDERFEVLIVMHHILGDAWSMGLINQEISQIYQALVTKTEPAISPLKIQYRDYAYWQRQQPVKESDLAYWKKALSGELPKFKLPKVGSQETIQGSTHTKPITQKLTKALNMLAKQFNTTMYVVMLTAYKLLISRYIQQSRVIVGSPFSNRDLPELEKLIGFFNETLVLSSQVDDQQSFGALVEEVKQTTLNALSHKNVPFNTLVNDLKPSREGKENPLFQTMFLYNPAPLRLDLGEAIGIEETMLDLPVSKFDLTLFVNEVGNGQELVFEYNTQISLRVIAAMADHLETLLKAIVDKPMAPVAEFSIYSEEQKNPLQAQWNGPIKEVPEWRSVQEIISSHNSKEDKEAVVFDNASISYKTLNKWSDKIAIELRSLGITKNQFVGLYTPRSVEMVAGILGILKAGGAYLPLDPDYPKERLEYMLSDTKAEVMLYHPELKDSLPGKIKQSIALRLTDGQEDIPKVEFINTPEDFAYVIYTSGSTGKPKGVPVTHGNLIHSTTARFDFFKDPLQSFLLLSSFSFDSSVVGIFWSLCTGGTLVLPPKRIEQEIEGLSEIIHRYQVSHTLMLPSLYQVLINFADAEKLQSLSAVIVAGEACSQALKTAHFAKLPETRLYNEYGPTEASVWCIAHEIKSVDEVIPIGRPIANSSAYILDKNLQPVPIAAPGELYIAGIGVTQGYLNQPELTKERFLDNPFAQGGKMYKTGDLARFRDNGTIDFLGRADQQVKIRGFRVEPEEIRNCILEEPEVTEALVKVLTDEAGNKQLMAWVQSTQETLEITLRQNLKAKLPAYMVPAGIQVLAALPKLPNGKVDGSQLISMVTKAVSVQTYTAPANKKEELLTNIWQEVLQVDSIGVFDNFFNIGGDSILSIQIVAKARQEGLKIGPTDLFTHQDIRTLSDAINWQESEITPKYEKLNYPVTFGLSHQQEAFLLHSLQAENDQGLLQLEFNIKGDLQADIMLEAWRKVLALHPIMRTSFHWQETQVPYQVIHEQADIHWEYLESCTDIEAFKAANISKALDLSTPGGGRITLVKKAPHEFSLLWLCHHILVDGWSGAIVFKDALTCYRALTEEKEVQLVYVPDYRQFLDWKAAQDIQAANGFWQEMLTDSVAPLFSEKTHSTLADQGFKDLSFYVDGTLTGALQQKAKDERLTINTLLQGAWMLTLSSFFGQANVSTGLTVTGRSCDFEGIDRITGLLMNVLPFQHTVDSAENLLGWLQKLQQKLTALRQFEHTDSDQIQGWTGNENKPFFDNLFVFGNFMSEKTQIGPLEVAAYHGDFSATFPITVRVSPGSTTSVNCRYDSSLIPENVAVWLMQFYELTIKALLEEGAFGKNVGSLLSEKPSDLYPERTASPQVYDKITTEFSGAENQTQLELLKLFEKVLDRQLIGIHDSYFDLGGTSLVAIRLVAEIDKEFGQKLSPTTLISRPTVAQLAQLLSEDDEMPWSSIIPMKTSGDKPPLFCLHSGGAHVLFYQGLARHLSADRPVYAIQPTGIEGSGEFHNSITEMATHYIAEMRKVQPEGPYHLLGSCFGNAVGIEMSHQLKELGEAVAVLYVVDSAPAFIAPPSPNGERKPVSRMFNMMKEGNWRGIRKKFRNRYIRLDKKLKANTRSEQEVELDEIVDSLNDVYVNYTWRPIDNNIVLIRSTEFSQRKDKGFHLKRWKFLAAKQLEVFEVEGHHLTLFDEPEVQGLTTAIKQHLLQLEK